MQTYPIKPAPEIGSSIKRNSRSLVLLLPRSFLARWLPIGNLVDSIRQMSLAPKGVHVATIAFVFCAGHALLGFPRSLAQDWPVFRGNSSASGVSDSTLPSTLELLWEYRVENGAFESTPVIVGDAVYIGDMDGTLFSLSLSDGHELWKVKTDSGFLASGAVKNEIMVIGDYDGKVRALNSQNGEEIWTFDAGASVDSGFSFFSEQVLIASEAGTLHSLDLKTGVKKWSYETRDQLRCTPAIAKDRTFLGGCDGQLHVVDLVSGSLVGTPFDLAGPTGSTPAIAGSSVVVTTQSGLVFCIDWESMTQRWRYADSERSSEIRSSPVVTETHALITTRNRRLLALQLSDGKLAWEAVLKKRCDGSPVACDGRAWLAATDGRILAFDLETGSPTWEMQMVGGFVGSPAIASNRLVVASDKGTIYCFGKKTTPSPTP